MSRSEADLLLVVGNIDSLAELRPEQTLLPLLAPDQQKWVLASRRPEDRLRRMLVRLLLAEGLKELEGAPLVETLGRIGRTEQGQPILEQLADDWEGLCPPQTPLTKGHGPLEPAFYLQMALEQISAASHADAWLAEHFQKQNALGHFANEMGVQGTIVQDSTIEHRRLGRCPQGEGQDGPSQSSPGGRESERGQRPLSGHSQSAPAGVWNVSFSHAGSLGVCLVGRPERTGRVGVDVEQRQEIVLDDVAAAFTPGERAYIAMAGGDALWRLWTAKEAVLKLLGTGFLADPQALEVLPPWRVASLPGLSLRHMELPVDSKYVLAVAAEYPPASLQVIAPSLNASRLA